MNLSTKDEIQSYVNRMYGKGTIVGEEITENSHKYFLSDEEYGFSYYVESSPEKIGFDGTSWYIEQKTSDFDEAYYATAEDMISSELRNVLDSENISETNHDLQRKVLFSIYFTEIVDDQIAASVCEQIGTLLQGFDTRKHWRSYSVTAYGSDNEYLGSFHMDIGKWMSANEEDIQKYMAEARRICGKDVEFERCEEVSIEDIPDIDQHTIDVTLSEEERRTAKLYYFRCDDESYFIADVLVDGGKYMTNASSLYEDSENKMLQSVETLIKEILDIVNEKEI